MLVVYLSGCGEEVKFPTAVKIAHPDGGSGSGPDESMWVCTDADGNKVVQFAVTDIESFELLTSK